jgi:hypothetical protein
MSFFMLVRICGLYGVICGSADGQNCIVSLWSIGCFGSQTLCRNEAGSGLASCALLCALVLSISCVEN